MTYNILKIDNKNVGYKKPPKITKIATLAHLFRDNTFLVEQYDVDWDTRILVNFTKRLENGYRTKFKHIFTGTIKEFNQFSKEKMRKWDSRKKKMKKANT